MFTLKFSAQTGRCLLQGDLSLDTYACADKELKALLRSTSDPLKLDGSGLTSMDTSGALLLHKIKTAPRAEPIELTSFIPEHQALLDLVAGTRTTPEPPPRKTFAPIRLLERLGEGAASSSKTGSHILIFLGQTTAALLRSLWHPGRFRLSSLSRHIDETGIAALPIVGLVAFLISIVLAYQGAFQLKPLGAEQFTVNLVGVSVLREMAVLLTAIMVAGRSGSAFTAEIGMMKVNQEVDALAVIGIDTFDSLVVPRLLALVITLPLLTFAADMLGLAGGSVICSNLLSIPWNQYWDNIHHAVKGTDFLVGMIKAPVFAFIIAVVACLHGLEVSGSAESVGKMTTASVVHSIFLILVADALFSILFVQIGI